MLPLDRRGPCRARANAARSERGDAGSAPTGERRRRERVPDEDHERRDAEVGARLGVAAAEVRSRCARRPSRPPRRTASAATKLTRSASKRRGSLIELDWKPGQRVADERRGDDDARARPPPSERPPRRRSRGRVAGDERVGEHEAGGERERGRDAAPRSRARTGGRRGRRAATRGRGRRARPGRTGPPRARSAAAGTPPSCAGGPAPGRACSSRSRTGSRRRARPRASA